MALRQIKDVGLHVHVLFCRFCKNCIKKELARYQREQNPSSEHSLNGRPVPKFQNKPTRRDNSSSKWRIWRPRALLPFDKYPRSRIKETLKNLFREVQSVWLLFHIYSQNTGTFGHSNCQLFGSAKLNVTNDYNIVRNFHLLKWHGHKCIFPLQNIFP